jgi:nitroreductase
MDNIFKHKSIRQFSDRLPDKNLINKLLEAAVRASNTGNMQVYSIVVTTDEELRKKLAECHFNQPASKAPLHVTFCVDINRFSKWCRLRDAEPGYDNFLWFVSGATDALLASQNFSLEAEHNGLGICYLGTCLYNARKIGEILNLPKGVIPVASVVAGYPDVNPQLTDRLPLEAVVHYETYHDYTADDINRLWAERENSDETKQLLEINQLPNLAQIFTQKRYTQKDNIAISENLISLLKEHGFLP